jgi:branched-chain amino acid transport system substrate-binding protein
MEVLPMSRRRKIIFGVIAIAVIALAVFLVRQRVTNEQSAYKIGAVLALTGRGATYGQRARNGMQLAVDELNSADAFRTQPISFIAEDSQSAAPQSLSAFRKLIDVDHVPVAVGFVLSDEVLTSAPVANERKVVLLTTAAGSDKIKDAGDFVFRNRESGEAQSEAIASACVQRLGIKDVAVLHSNSANGVSYRDGFKQALERLGGSALLTIGYNEGKTDYRAEIEQLRAKSPRAVYLAGLDQELGLILKQAKEVGFSTQFFASPGAISPKLLEVAGSAAEGLISASAPFDVDSTDQRVHAFTTSYKNRFNDSPDFIAANSYDAINIIAMCFKNGATNAEQIKSCLYSTKDYPGIGGLTSFNANGEVTKPVSLVQVKGGRFASFGGDRE